MSAPKKSKPGCDTLEHAKGCDASARSGARPNYGPLDDADELDAYDLMTNAPDIMDFEPCGLDCESTCLCRARPADGDVE